MSTAPDPEAASRAQRLAVPHDTLDQLMATAYLLHRDGHYVHAEVLCRGMLAAAPRYWYAAALLAATVEKRKLARRPRPQPQPRPARRRPSGRTFVVERAA
jgi:hypothetical protein